MRRTSLVLILVAASLFAAIPAVADSSDESWQIAVFASNAKTLVSPDARYCLMPDSMPIRPGNSVSLQDANGRVLGTAEFHDRVARSVGRGTFQPGEPCELQAVISPVAPQEGLSLVINPDPVPSPSSSSRVSIDPLVQSYGPFDWWYDQNGFKECRLLGRVQLGDGSPLVTTPLKEVEHCTLVAMLEFPIADEYVIEFGGEAQAADGD